MNGAEIALILPAIDIEPAAVDLKTVGYISESKKPRIIYEELIANFPIRAKTNLNELGIIDELDIDKIIKQLVINLIRPIYFKTKIQEYLVFVHFFLEISLIKK